jgi:hypothetical protein
VALRISDKLTHLSLDPALPSWRGIYMASRARRETALSPGQGVTWAVSIVSLGMLIFVDS